MADRPTLVLVPGLLCDEATWADQVQTLSHTHRCVIVDHGSTDSLVCMAEHALTQAGAQTFAVAGHSMGGRVAMEMVRLAPQRIERLALLDTSWHPLPEGREGEVERRLRMDMLRQARRDGMAAMAREWARGMVHPRWHATPVFEQVIAMLVRKTPDHYAAQIQALLTRPDASGILQQVQCPTLLLCGEQDAWSTPQRHLEMQAWMPHATLVRVPDCGHMSTMESPEAVTQALQAWLG